MQILNGNKMRLQKLGLLVMLTLSLSACLRDTEFPELEMDYIDVSIFCTFCFDDGPHHWRIYENDIIYSEHEKYLAGEFVIVVRRNNSEGSFERAIQVINEGHFFELDKPLESLRNEPCFDPLPEQICVVVADYAVLSISVKIGGDSISYSSGGPYPYASEYSELHGFIWQGLMEVVE